VGRSLVAWGTFAFEGAQNWFRWSSPWHKNEGGRPRPDFGATDARALLLSMEGYDGHSALYLDGHRISKLKLERSFRAQLDVLLAGEKRSGRSGSCTNRAADERTGSSAGERAD
jgi:hypothetical protein